MELFEAMIELIQALWDVFVAVGQAASAIGLAIYEIGSESDFLAGMIGLLCCFGGLLPWTAGVIVLRRIRQDRYQLIL
jgi:drug/metabolite transporter (DMT)-like permease